MGDKHEYGLKEQGNCELLEDEETDALQAAEYEYSADEDRESAYWFLFADVAILVDEADGWEDGYGCIVFVLPKPKKYVIIV